MKRLLLLAALAATSAACQQIPEAGNLANRALNANVAPSPAPTVSDKDLTDKETQLWNAINSKNYDAFAALLADGQLYVSPGGVHNKAETVEVVRNLALTEPAALSDWKVIHLDKDAAVVTYTARIKGTYRGQPLPDTADRHSTAWVKGADGRWLAYYHQETRVEQATARPAASPAAAATPAAAASPAAPAPATPIDVENAIWDALRRKDYDGFAAFLASDAVEVEPQGVSDKAGTVNAVKTVDFTGVTLNDVRELKLDADASLVTYLVKGPNPPFGGAGMRHSTILVKRGDRWVAVFHQGTQAEGQ